MDCLKDIDFQNYLDGTLSTVENSMIRDHLIQCERCRMVYNEMKAVEGLLAEPVLLEPPAEIKRAVKRKILSQIPSYSSVAALIAASFLLLVTWTYVYFDFANNSLVQALKITSHRIVGFLGLVIQFVSSVFSAVYGIFMALNKLLEIVFNVRLNNSLLMLFLLVIGIFPFLAAYKIMALRKKHVHSEKN